MNTKSDTVSMIASFVSFFSRAAIASCLYVRFGGKMITPDWEDYGHVSLNCLLERIPRKDEQPILGFNYEALKEVFNRDEEQDPNAPHVVDCFLSNAGTTDGFDSESGCELEVPFVKSGNNIITERNGKNNFDLFVLFADGSFEQWQMSLIVRNGDVFVGLDCLMNGLLGLDSDGCVSFSPAQPVQCHSPEAWHNAMSYEGSYATLIESFNVNGDLACYAQLTSAPGFDYESVPHGKKAVVTWYNTCAGVGAALTKKRNGELVELGIFWGSLRCLDGPKSLVPRQVLEFSSIKDGPHGPQVWNVQKVS